MNGMNITLITPAATRSRSGNRVTAVRWARLLRELGHRVRIDDGPAPTSGDLLVAIHAYRSAGAIAHFRERWPQRPIIVLLAGTDVYRFQHSDARVTLASMQIADRLVGLHDRVADDIPARFAAKLRVILQSAAPLAGPRRPSQRRFDVCVAGHLRDEKDPLRAAIAARALPAASRLRIVHLGKAHDEAWAQAARAEMAANPRYLWRGEVTPGQVRRCFARSHALVISSVMEGGANIVSEAIAARLPVIASRIPGNVGLLGAGHPAYFPPGDDAALAALLARAEFEPDFLASVGEHGDALAPRFTRERERAAWAELLDEIG